MFYLPLSFSSVPAPQPNSREVSFDQRAEALAEGAKEEEEEDSLTRKHKRSRANSADDEVSTARPKLLRGSSATELDYASFITQEDTPKDGLDGSLDVPEFERFEEMSTAKKELEENVREITPESSRSPSPFSGDLLSTASTDSTHPLPEDNGAPVPEAEVSSSGSHKSTEELTRDQSPVSTTPPGSPPMSTKIISPASAVKRITVPVERDYLRCGLSMPLVASLSAKIFEISNRGAKDWDQLLGSSLVVQGRISPDVVKGYLKQVGVDVVDVDFTLFVQTKTRLVPCRSTRVPPKGFMSSKSSQRESITRGITPRCLSTFTAVAAMGSLPLTARP